MYRLLILLSFLITFSSYAQEKYWITFKDKDITEYKYENYLSKETIRNRNRYNLPLYQFSDVPVNPSYLSQLENLDIQILCASRWLNSVSAFLDFEQLNEVSSLDFVKEVIPIDRRIQVMGDLLDVMPENYYLTQKQMQAEKFTENGITGNGVLVGVIDAGFYKAWDDKFLAHVFKEDRIIKQKDFLTPAFDDLVNDTIKSDYHGRIVLSWICGYDSTEGLQLGMARNSKFLLARSENESREYRGEEDNWVKAMEWMDSAGVRLINTSLGYSINMDDPKDNYKKEEMNGHTTRISKAAQIATDEKGIFVVVSAGNEGRNPFWRIISSPADAEGVLSVGATIDTSWMKIDYSSIGPDFLPYLKPNVACHSQSGTSFSAPAVTGFVACLMEKDSTLDNKKLKLIVEKSGHIYPFGNNYVGYGIPQAGKALKMIEDKNYSFCNHSEKKIKYRRCFLNIGDDLVQEAVVFHKKNDKVVLQQEIIAVNKGKLRVKKVIGAKKTTVVYGLEVTEIIWE